MDTKALAFFQIWEKLRLAISNKKSISVIEKLQYYRNIHWAINYPDCVLTESSVCNPVKDL